MNNEEKKFAYRNGEAVESAEVSIGDHSEYLQRINNGQVKFFALPSNAVRQSLSSLATPSALLDKQYLRLVLTAHDKTRIHQKKQGKDGIISEINQLVDQNIRSEWIILEKLPGSGYRSLDSFLVENADKLHQYVGYKEGVLATSENRLIITDLLTQQVENAPPLEQPSPESSNGDSAKYSLIITYRVDNYRGEEADPLTGSLPRVTASGWLKIFTGLILLLLAFLLYYFRLWQKLLAWVRSFFSS